MKKNSLKIISILLVIAIIVTISIFAYYGIKKENYSLQSKHFGTYQAGENESSSFLKRTEEQRVKFKIFLNSITQSPADIKDKEIYFTKIANKQFSLPKNAPPAPLSGNMVGEKDSSGKIIRYNFEPISVDNSLLKWSPFPNKTAEEMDRLKADKKAKEYINAIDDAEASAVSGILNALYGAFKEGWTQDAALELAKQVGIGLLKIGLACMGLGFINAGLDSLFGGGSAPPAIDYEKIKNIVTDAVQKGHIDDYGRHVNINIANVNDFIKTYTDLKYTAAQATCPDSYNTLSKNISCMKTPSSRNPELKYDPNIVFNNTGTTDGKTKRQFLTDKLTSNNAIHDMVTNSQYGINGLIEYGKINAVASAELYHQFLLVIGLTIVYYQELSMVDTDTINGKYVNPWLSRYIGDPNENTIGGQQIAGSLLGELQSICQKFFDYIKTAYLLFWNSIQHSGHSDCCGAEFWCNCVRWWEISFQQGLFPGGWFENYRVAFLGNWNDEGARNGFGNPGTHWAGGTPNFEIVRWWYMHCFNEYMNNPLETLQVLKRMAGIQWVKGEQGFSFSTPNPGTHWAGGTPTNPSIIYSPEGGYPFGTKNYNYRQVVLAKDGSGLNFEKNNVYCSHALKLEKYKICPSNPNMYSTKPIDATIFNVPGGQQFTDNMTCPVGYEEIVSCLKPRFSPGNNKGEIELNSRETWCRNSNGDYKRLIPYYETGDFTEDSCVPPAPICGYGTPVPVTKPINVSNRVFQVRITFKLIDSNLVVGTRAITQINPVISNSLIPNDNNIICYRCNYNGKNVFTFSNVLRKILNFYKFKSNYPYLIDHVMLSANEVFHPTDPGQVNGTTRPPVNTNCEIIGNDYIRVLSAYVTSSNGVYLIVTLEIKGEDV
jgi:hypothetical protein